MSVASASRDRPRSRRLPFVLVLSLLATALAAGAAGGGRGVVVEEIRHSSGPERTRIVLDLDGPLTFRKTVGGSPPRVVIELPGVRFGPRAEAPAVRDGRLLGVRLLPPDRLPAQVVLDLDGKRAAKVFALGPGGGRGHRLVIDVLGPRAAGAPPQETAAAKPPATAREERAAPSPARRGAPERPWVIVIDPGHGGRDPGAKGPGGVQEKDVCLAIAKALAAEIDRRPGYKTVLTRDRDIFLHLRQRTRIAAENKADLFVSIHANASHKKGVRGTEVYFLSLRGASDEAAREVAMRENAADHVGGVPPESQGEIADILVDLLQTSALERSSELAATVVEHLRRDGDLELRGVKQAGFDVLKTAGMPSILIEAAFISHAKESKLLKSPSFQRRFAGLLGSGIADFLTRAAATEAPVGLPAAASPSAAPSPPAGS